jgi:hypothetical protein
MNAGDEQPKNRLERPHSDCLRAINASEALANLQALGLPLPEIEEISWKTARIIEKETRALNAKHAQMAAEALRKAVAHLRKLHNVQPTFTLNGEYSIQELPEIFRALTTDPVIVDSYEREANNLEYVASYLNLLAPRGKGHPVGLGERFFIGHMALLCKEHGDQYHDDLCCELLDDIVFYVRGSHEKKSREAYSRMRRRLMNSQKNLGNLKQKEDLQPEVGTTGYPDAPDTTHPSGTD